MSNKCALDFGFKNIINILQIGTKQIFRQSATALHSTWQSNLCSANSNKVVKKIEAISHCCCSFTENKKITRRWINVVKHDTLFPLFSAVTFISSYLHHGKNSRLLRVRPFHARRPQSGQRPGQPKYIPTYVGFRQRGKNLRRQIVGGWIFRQCSAHHRIFKSVYQVQRIQWYFTSSRI